MAQSKKLNSRQLALLCIEEIIPEINHKMLTQNINSIGSFFIDNDIDSSKFSSMAPTQLRDDLIVYSHHKIKGGPANKLFRALRSTVNGSGSAKCGGCFKPTLDAKRCSQCSKSYCDDCCVYNYTVSIFRPIYCESCTAKNEDNPIFTSIVNGAKAMDLGIMDDVVQTIVDYCRGYVFECGNKDDLCRNEIIFDNTFQFTKRRDYKKQTIYCYETVKVKGNNKPTISMNGEEYRMFCSNCSASKLTKCRCGKNYESGDRGGKA
eukprot:240697_1